MASANTFLHFIINKNYNDFMKSKVVLACRNEVINFEF